MPNPVKIPLIAASEIWDSVETILYSLRVYCMYNNAQYTRTLRTGPGKTIYMLELSIGSSKLGMGRRMELGRDGE